MDLDLAIVGGGPAGIATALFFAAAAPHRRGRVAVLERERYPREKICAGALGARADRLLDTIGVRVDVPSVPIHGFAVVTAGERLRARDEPSAPPIGRVVRRLEFDRAFADEARARGLSVVEGARVTGLDVEREGVRLRTTVGEILARAVVGADGVGSFVRRALGLPRGRFLAQVVEVDTPAVAADEARDLLHFDLSDRSLPGYGWDFPTLVAGVPLVCRGLYGMRPDTGAHAGRDGSLDVSARLQARLDRLGVSGSLRFKRFSERGLSLPEALARPRALLVGEAAGIDPVLGEGIAQAIFYGATAGPYLARCLDRGELSFAGWPDELRRSRVGLDLRLRAAFLPWLYGRPRPLVEGWVGSSPDLALAGMRYFAGDRVPRARLGSAAWTLGAVAARAGLAATSRRWPPWR